jgi:hypothetical protein
MLFKTCLIYFRCAKLPLQLVNYFLIYIKIWLEILHSTNTTTTYVTLLLKLTLV